MRYVELTGNEVRFILPTEFASEYPVLPPDAVEIALDADIAVGDIYENGVFRRKTQDELAALYKPAFNTARTRLFAETSWVRERHADRLELGIDDSENWKAWLAYWQALRDLPQQPGFDPREPNWPEKPE